MYFSRDALNKSNNLVSSGIRDRGSRHKEEQKAGCCLLTIDEHQRGCGLDLPPHTSKGEHASSWGRPQ